MNPNESNHESNFTTLLAEISGLASNNRPNRTTLQRITHLIVERLDSSRVEIWVPLLGGRAAASRYATGQNVRAKAPFVVFSRRVVVRGSDYGWFSVDILNADLPPASTILTLETVVLLIGSLVEKVRLEEQREDLRVEIEDLRESLVRLKLVARAAGIIASLKGISQRDAERWIEAEALRTRRPPEEVADRLVLSQTSAIGRAPGREAPPLRKTA
jgi:hypothetical protein